jgi:hypothetical protein
MKSSIFVWILLVSLFACKSNTSEQKATENEKKDTNITQELELRKQSKEVASQNTWKGLFTFDENPGETAGGTPILYSYAIEFLPDGSVRYDIDGYQTMVRAICSLKEKDEKTAELIFERFGDDDLFKSQFQKGQVVATLIRIDEKKIKVFENGKTEKGIFQKIK